MRSIFIIILLSVFVTSCKKSKKQEVVESSEVVQLDTIQKPEFTSKEEVDSLPSFINISKIPDSLKLGKQNLKADFNGDDKVDFASIVINKRDNKKGVIIIHNSKNQEIFVFGAGSEINEMTDLSWIDIFKTISKGVTVSPTLVDEETGDIIGSDEKQNFQLIGDAIEMGVEESCGGGIIFWNGNSYQWYHIE